MCWCVSAELSKIQYWSIDLNSSHQNAYFLWNFHNFSPVDGDTSLYEDLSNEWFFSVTVSFGVCSWSEVSPSTGLKLWKFHKKYAFWWEEFKSMLQYCIFDNSAETHQHINTSTHQHINTSRYQHINTSTHQHINTSTHQHINKSTQHINTSTHQHINTWRQFNSKQAFDFAMQPQVAPQQGKFLL